MTIGQKIDATLHATVKIDRIMDTATFDCQLCGERITHPLPAYTVLPGEGLYVILAHLFVVADPGTQCPIVQRDGIAGVIAAIVSTDPSTPGSLTKLREMREREARKPD